MVRCSPSVEQQKAHFTRPAFALAGRGLTGCHFTDPSPVSFLAWIPGLMFETLLCLLMLYKVWGLYGDEYSSPLLNFLIRDRYVSRHHSTMQ
jgi:hypothetical protein